MSDGRASSGSSNGDVALDMDGHQNDDRSGADAGVAEAAAAKKNMGTGDSTLPFEQL